jgi:hypothetical protein
LIPIDKLNNVSNVNNKIIIYKKIEKIFFDFIVDIQIQKYKYKNTNKIQIKYKYCNSIFRYIYIHDHINICFNKQCILPPVFS